MPVSLMTHTIFLTTEGKTCFDMIRVASETIPLPSDEEPEPGVDIEGPDRFLKDEHLADKLWTR
jgi:hypothetical protein